MKTQITSYLLLTVLIFAFASIICDPVLATYISCVTGLIGFFGQTFYTETN